MSNILQFVTGAAKLRYQDFNSSGTFTPSSRLVSNGGQCIAIVVGGGGGGAKAQGSVYFAGAGQPGRIKIGMVTITTPTSVTIGSGGIGSTSETAFSVGSSGGTSTVATLSAAGGDGGVYNLTGPNIGQLASSIDYIERSMNVPGNQGLGGNGGLNASGQNGTSGFVRIVWFE